MKKEKVWVARYREAGEEVQVVVFANRRSAEILINSFLCEVLDSRDIEYSPSATIDVLGDFCSDNDLAYFKITEQEVV